MSKISVGHTSRRLFGRRGLRELAFAGQLYYGGNNGINNPGFFHNGKVAKIVSIVTTLGFAAVGGTFAGIAGTSSYNFVINQNSTINVGLGVFNYTNTHVSDSINPEIRGLSYEQFISKISEESYGEHDILLENAKLNLKKSQDLPLDDPNRDYAIKISKSRLEFVEQLIAANNNRLTVIISLTIGCASFIALILAIVFAFIPRKNKKQNSDNNSIEPMY